MSPRISLAIFLFFSLLIPLSAQGRDMGNHPYVLRGEVAVDLQPIYAGHIDREYPLDIPTAGRRALEESALFFSAMIYGWSFTYEIGERARQIDEVLELKPLGAVQAGDPSLRITDTEVRDYHLRVWADYHLSFAQQHRMQVWRSGMIRNAQGLGYAPSFFAEYPGWIAVRKIALEDAARSALRAMLRNSERNRPREVNGFISLASFPRYYIDSGRWVVSARFRVQITEILPFSVH